MKYKRNIIKIKLPDWIFYFAHAFRYEASTMDPGEARFIADYFNELTLAKPCQIEVLKFKNPYRLLILFFLDQTKPDLPINKKNVEWTTIEHTIDVLRNNYSPLQIKSTELYRIIKQCKNSQQEIIYGIDYTRNVCAIYFTHDPRKRQSPIPAVLDCSKPQDVAEMIFRLTVDQSSTYS